MARKRVVEAPSLHSWEDVNDALRQIAEAQIALGEIQSDMQKQILGAQKVAEEQSKPLNDNVAKLEREIAAPGEGEAGGDHPPSQVPPDDGLHRGGREGQQGGSEEVR